MHVFFFDVCGMQPLFSVVMDYNNSKSPNENIFNVEETMNDSHLQRIFRSFFISDRLYFGLWIGLNDIDEEGTFKWIDNQPLSFSGAITNQKDGHDCLYLRKNKLITWKLKSCKTTEPYICKKSENV